MKFEVTIPAVYTIPDKQVRKVCEALREDWSDADQTTFELFPNDIVRKAQSMGIGNLKFDQNEVESNEEALVEADIP